MKKKIRLRNMKETTQTNYGFIERIVFQIIQINLKSRNLQ